jgi:hypothetical protein
MKWIIASSRASEHIIPVQKYLFGKYAPNEELYYITNSDRPIEDWCKNILLNLLTVKEEQIVFGLDDYLPTGPLKKDLSEIKLDGSDRCGFGEGDSRTKKGLVFDPYIVYTEDAPYQVTCQFSIWKTESLIEVLREVNGSPWAFEIEGKCKAIAFRKPLFTWVEAGALSRKWEGININGMNEADIQELIKLGFVDEEDLVLYLGKGNYRKYV